MRFNKINYVFPLAIYLLILQQAQLALAQQVQALQAQLAQAQQVQAEQAQAQLAQGGVLPNIQAVLLPKESEKTKA